MAMPLKRQVVAHLEILMMPGVTPDPMLCFACGTALDLHQPNPDQPDQMLGVCLGCNHWHLIRSEPRSGTTIITLPSVKSIECSWLSRDGTG